MKTKEMNLLIYFLYSIYFFYLYTLNSLIRLLFCFFKLTFCTKNKNLNKGNYKKRKNGKFSYTILKVTLTRARMNRIKYETKKKDLS